MTTSHELAKVLDAAARVIPRFDYEHGGCTTKTDAEAIVAWLNHTMGDLLGRVGIERSGDLFRIWCEDIEGYFWPEDASFESWAAAV